MKKLTLTFEWDGKTVHKDAEGFTGSSCMTETEFIEAALGQSVKMETKPEYYIPEPASLEAENKISI